MNNALKMVTIYQLVQQRAAEPLKYVSGNLSWKL